MSRAPLWIFADQLGSHVHGGEHADREVVLVESSAALGRRRFHRQKLHLVLSGIRHLDAELGDRSTSIRTTTYRDALSQLGRPVVVHEPTSRAAATFVERLRDEGLVEEILPTPTFALSRAEFAAWAGTRTRFRMADFYRAQRERFGLLLEPDGRPEGGRWSLDDQNREPPPKGARTLAVPGPWVPVEDDIDATVRRDLDDWAIPTVGRDGPRSFAVTEAEAVAARDHFVSHRLGAFGTYEDAVLEGDWAMAHSLLSVPLNLGLLDPLETAMAAEHAYRRGAVGLNAAEGFVRQVIGWREYVWHLYWHLGPTYRQANALAARRPLPAWFAELDSDAVDAACLRSALAGVRDRGWVHHIQRLMVLGNHALQRGYDPDEMTEWFQTAFVDGFDWVMPVNVIGMSQHADGGRIATKPYASGGAYINRMSDHCRGCRFDPKVRVGEDACPYTGGYWMWVAHHRERLAANNRTAQAVSSMHRLRDLDELVVQEEARHAF
ncbi:MAG: cryptochrome/photolyase family protein [Ilumatobacteraceae bacterium]